MYSFKRLQKKKEYNDNNKEVIREKSKIYYYKNKEKCIKSSIEYNRKRREKFYELGLCVTCGKEKKLNETTRNCKNCIDNANKFKWV